MVWANIMSTGTAHEVNNIKCWYNPNEMGSRSLASYERVTALMQLAKIINYPNVGHNSVPTYPGAMRP